MYIREIIGNKIRGVFHSDQNYGTTSNYFLKSIDVHNKELELVIKLKSDQQEIMNLLKASILENLAEYQKDFNIAVKFEI
jgi:hypothetical protein